LGEVGGIVEGAESMLAPPPLLANLGKASANAYYMDMTVGGFYYLVILEIDLLRVYLFVFVFLGRRCK
jgi:hypothetical protein